MCPWDDSPEDKRLEADWWSARCTPADDIEADIRARPLEPMDGHDIR